MVYYNYARTLLLNVAGQDTTCPGEELIPRAFRPVVLPPYLGAVREVLFGKNPDRFMLNYRARQLLPLLHSTPLYTGIREIDSRETYDTTSSTFFDPQLFLPQVATAANPDAVSGETSQPAQLHVLGTPASPDLFGVCDYQFTVVNFGTESAPAYRISRSRPSAVVDIQNPVFADGYSSAMPLRDTGYQFRVSSFSTQNLWSVSLRLRPTHTLSELAERLARLDNSVLGPLFFSSSAAYDAYRACWLQHPVPACRLGGLLLALVSRTHELHQAALTNTAAVSSFSYELASNAISGPDGPHYVGSSYMLTLTTSAADPSITWEVTGPATLASGQGTKTPVLLITGVGDVCVTARVRGALTPLQSVSKCISTVQGSVVVTAVSGATPTAGVPYQLTASTAIPGAVFQWTVEPGDVILSGQGTSTVTVQFNARLTHTVSVAVSVGGTAAASKVVTVQGNLTISSADSMYYNGTDYVFTGTTDVPDPIWTWSVGAGDTIISGQGTNTVTVRFNTFNSRSVDLVVSGGGSANQQKTVNVLGSASITAPAGPYYAGQSYVFTGTSNVPTPTWNWSVGSGVTLISGQGTNTVTVRFDALNARSLSLAVAGGGSASAGWSGTILGNASVTAPAGPFYIGQDYVFTGSSDVPSPLWTWSVGAGDTIISGQGTNTVTIRFGVFGTRSVGLSVAGGGSASATWSGSTVYSANVVPPAGTIYSLVDNSFTATTNAVSPVYTWSVGAGDTIVSGQGTASVVVKFGTSGSRTVSLSITEGAVPAASATWSGTVTAFVPSVYSGLAMWLDASDASTLTLDGLNNVAQWRDKSGNARHASQSTTTMKPTYLANGINGIPALVGDGVDDSLTLSYPGPGTNHNYYVVAAFDTVRNMLPQYGGFINGDNVSTWCIRISDTSANPALGAQVPFIANVDLHPANSAHNVKSGIPAVYSFLRKVDTFKAKWTYGTPVQLGPVGSGLHVTQATTTNVLFRGWGGTPASFRISELVCYGRDLTTTEQSVLSAYFLGKYGVGI